MKLYEFFSKPGSWCQHTMVKGEACCLLGAIEKFYKGHEDSIVSRILDKLDRGIAPWNDHPQRTREDVIALCKELDI